MATGEGGRQVHRDGEAPTRHHFVWLRLRAFVQLKTKQICKLNVNKTTTTKLIKVKNIKNPQNLNQQYEVSMTSLPCSKHKVTCGVQWQEVPCTLYCVQQLLLVLGSGTISPTRWKFPSLERRHHIHIKRPSALLLRLLELDCFGKLIKPHTHGLLRTA